MTHLLNKIAEMIRHDDFPLSDAIIRQMKDKREMEVKLGIVVTQLRNNLGKLQ